MKTGLDSSVILSIYNGEPKGERWMERLVQLRKRSILVVCEIVIAETRIALPSSEKHWEQLERLGAHCDPVHFDTACLAGEMHQAYRQSGGGRQRLLADFLVGAHAMLQADQLATDDVGFMRKYFRGLATVDAR